ncbi:MAG: pyridoxal phosphate-dependent aminotransferase [Phycisphaerae bacterium]|nr:pyridoxal phosphate-dependent aminotransferase [Gemmatimonadaceae bacterium]
MPIVFRPSSNIERLKESATIAVGAKARALKAQGRDIIDMGVGEPDFDTPAFIRQAANLAVENGATRYTSTEGIPPLRDAIAADANRLLISGGTPVTAAEVVVSNGSKQSLYNACVCLFGPGDEVLVPTPSWTSYYEMLELARCIAVPVFGDVERSLKVTAQQLADASNERTRGVMLNSPSNPTGAVYTDGELKAILDLAYERGWWVISDEIYQRISYDAASASVMQLTNNRDNLVIINGVAKAYAMTGWRIGWAIAPVAVAKAMTAFQSHTTSNAAAVSQHAALAALANPAQTEPTITHMVTEFHKRRDAVLGVLSEFPSVKFVHPAGAFYLYIDVHGYAGADDPGTVFAEQLIEQENVAVVPGAAFLTPGWIRASYAMKQAVAEEGVRRIARHLVAGRKERQ